MTKEYQLKRRIRTAARIEVNYEEQAPRCLHCDHFVKAKRLEKNGVVATKPTACWANPFSPSPDGLCDKFKDKKTGAVLEATP